MALSWVRETAARWDDDKARIVGGQPAGVFDVGPFAAGAPVPGEWWRVTDGDRTVGYGWMDITWNGAEILLAVEPGRQKHGVGTFILDHLEREASARGLNQLYNVVRPTHPQARSVARWLESRGFQATEDGELRRPVRKG